MKQRRIFIIGVNHKKVFDMIQFDIIIKTDGLILEIEQYAWQTGKNLLSNEGAEKIAANVQCCDADRDITGRFLLSAIADAEREFSRYIIRIGDDYRYTGIVPDTIQFAVQFPDSFNISQKEALNINLRNYLVYLSLVSWFKLVRLPDEVNICSELAEKFRHNFIECANKRVKPVRRNLGRRWG